MLLRARLCAHHCMSSTYGALVYSLSVCCCSVDFLQVLSIFTSFNFRWPKALKALFVAASASTYNDQLVAPECSISQWTFDTKYDELCRSS